MAESPLRVSILKIESLLQVKALSAKQDPKKGETMDLESVLIQVANGGQEPLTRLIIGVAAVVGIIGVIGYLMSLRKQARHSTKGVKLAEFLPVSSSVCLITLKAQMNSGGATLGFGDVSFGPVSYGKSIPSRKVLPVPSLV